MRFLRSFFSRVVSWLLVAAFFMALRQGFGLSLIPWRVARPGESCAVDGLLTKGKTTMTDAWVTLVCRGNRWRL